MRKPRAKSKLTEHLIVVVVVIGARAVSSDGMSNSFGFFGHALLDLIMGDLEGQATLGEHVLGSETVVGRVVMQPPATTNASVRLLATSDVSLHKFEPEGRVGFLDGILADKTLPNEDDEGLDTIRKEKERQKKKSAVQMAKSDEERE